LQAEAWLFFDHIVPGFAAYHVERLVQQYRRVEKLSEPGAAQELYDSRELKYHYDEEGYLVLRARFPAEQGELVIRALERAMESATEVGTNNVTAETPLEPVAARRADALCEIAESYLNHPDNAGSTADRYQVVVHVAAETHVANLENGPCVSAETSARIACDCSVTTIEEDASGEPLNISRRSGTIPPPMRRALKARDGGCRFPGCTSRRFCDGHQIEHWQNGGETDFVDQRQQRLAEYEPPAPKSIDATLAWMYRRFDRHRLGSDACAAKWYAGDTMDWITRCSLHFKSSVSGRFAGFRRRSMGLG